MTVLYPHATWKPVPNHGGNMAGHNGLVLHVQVGDGSLEGWFSNPASQVSSTFWVAKSGTVEQYVDADETAWAQAEGNGTYNSVETEGHPVEPLTTQQIESLAALYRWGHDTFSWPFVVADVPGQSGFGWHGMGGAAWGGHPDCPGDTRKAQMPEILQRAQGAVINPPSPAPTPAPTPKPVPEPTTYPPFPGQLLIYIAGHPMINSLECRQWQQQMQNRGWHIVVDAVYGPASAGVCHAFQVEKGLTPDSIVGPITWEKSWTAPIT